MKYDPDVRFDEIMRRGQRLVKIRRQRITILLFSAASFLLVFSGKCILTFSQSQKVPITDSYYGAFLLTPQAGGYVLIGVIAFALGAVFTLLCKHLSKKNKP